MSSRAVLVKNRALERQRIEYEAEILAEKQAELRRQSRKRKKDIKRKEEANAKNESGSRKKRGTREGTKKKPQEKPKPPAYRLLRKNYYAAGIYPLKKVDEEVPMCTCSLETGCDEDCVNRGLLMECAPGRCPSLVNPKSKSSAGSDEIPQYCSNTCIQTRTFPSVTVFRTFDKGWALRLNEAVKARTIIVEYLGEVITKEECLIRMEKYEKNDDFYFAGLDRNLMLDAKPMGSIARFANHSCEPNCQMEKWTVLGEPRICLVALVDLDKGTEITYNYGYSNDGLDVPRQICKCGSANCSGILGGRVVETVMEKWMKRGRDLLDRINECESESQGQGLRQDVEIKLTHKIHEDSLRAFMKEIELDEDEDEDEDDKYTKKNKGREKGKHDTKDVNTNEDTTVNVDEAYHGILDTNEYKELSVRLSIVDQWNEEATKLQDSATPVKSDDVYRMVQKAPTGIRPKLATILLNKVKDADRVEKTAQMYVKILKENQKENGNGYVAEDKKLSWAVMISLLREAGAAAPILGGSNTLKLYYIYISCENWVKEYVAPYLPAIADWTVSKSLNPLYRMSLAGFGKKSMSSMIFATEDLLEDMIGALLQRQEYKKKQEIWNEKDIEVCVPSLDITADSDSDSDIEIKTSKSKSNSKKKYKVEKEVNREFSKEHLFCFCCNSETYVESGISSFVCCDTCDKWFHPECINQTPVVDLSSAKRKTKEDDTIFVCPLCTHARNYMSSLLKPVKYEWNFYQPIQRSKTLIATIAEDRARSIVDADFHRSLPHFIKSGFTEASLGLALENSKQLPVSNMPIVGMLECIQNEWKSWQKRANEILKRIELHVSLVGANEALQPQKKTKKKNDSLMVFKRGQTSATSMSVTVFAPSSDEHSEFMKKIVGLYVTGGQKQINEEIILLSCLMTAYLELRILRVQDPVLLQLRQAVWRIHARSLVRLAAQLWNISDPIIKHICARHGALLPTLDDYEMALKGADELENGLDFDFDFEAISHVPSLKQCPEYLIIKDSIKICQSTLKELGSELQVIINTPNKNKTVFATPGIKNLWERLKILRQVVDIDSDYVVFVGVCVLSRLFKDMKVNNATKASDVCWCGGDEDADEDDEWICCDKCDHWFHNRCVFPDMDGKLLKNIMTQKFYCPGCCVLKHGKVYPHSWESTYIQSQ
jgi:hypothetical protein